MFGKVKYYMVSLVLLLAALGFLLLHVAENSVDEFEQYQARLSRNSLQHVDHLIGLYMDELKLSVALFAEKHRDLIRELIELPYAERNVNRLNELMIIGFEHAVTFTLADASGKVLLHEVPEFVGKDCKENLHLFATEKGRSMEFVRIHPDKSGAHFDVMHTLTIDDGNSVIFFMSFRPDVIAGYLKNIPPAGHELVLLNRFQDGAIELTAQGGLNSTTDKAELTAKEHSQIIARREVSGTMWELVGMLDPVFVSAEVALIYRKLSLTFVLFTFGGVLFIMMLYRYKNGSGRQRLIDGLTNDGYANEDGIANRQLYDAVLKKEVGRSKRHNTELSVVLLKIDYYSQLVSAVGEDDAQDCVRKIVVSLDREFQRGSDFIAHHGGAEVAIILPDTNQEQALAQGERVRHLIQNHKMPHPGSTDNDYVTVSIGVATLGPDNDMSANELNGVASSALQHAIAHGRNKVSAGGM